MIKNASLKDN
jgi:hypothetical protein